MSGSPNFTQQQLAGFDRLLQQVATTLHTNAANATQTAQGMLDQYYQAQTAAGRGYGELAQGVVDNSGVFGTVANLEVASAIGQSQWNAKRLSVALGLAQADLLVMQGNGGFFPVMAQIEDYHLQVFSDFGIPQYAWGGFSDAAFGLDWSQGHLTTAEFGGGQHSYQFSNVSEATIDEAILALNAALTTRQNLDAVEGAIVTPSDILSVLKGAAVFWIMGELYAKRFNRPFPGPLNSQNSASNFGSIQLAEIFPSYATDVPSGIRVSQSPGLTTIEVDFGTGAEVTSNTITISVGQLGRDVEFSDGSSAFSMADASASTYRST